MATHLERPDVESFYHLGRGLPRFCNGAACFVARHRDPERWRAAVEQDPPLYCLGKCYLGPAALADDVPPRVEISAPVGIVLERIASGGATTLDRYGGYEALEQARRMQRADLVDAIDDSGLRGRGGAGFPTGKKWRAVLGQSEPIRYVVANADEGDPGAYIDRFILEQDPHALIEGIAIAAHAVGASRGYIYLRREYPRAEVVLRAALAEAKAEIGHGKWTGKGVRNAIGHGIGSGGGDGGEGTLGTDFEIELVIGQGSYVCGEETALLNSIEGRRPEVRARPPYPTERGLFGKPTLVQNVETLVNVPWIVRRGAAAYRALGAGSSRGTKVVSLNSLFARPGLYEVELGTPVRRIVEELGGGLAEGRLAGVLIGGPLAGILPPSLLDTPLGFEELRAVGASVGHGGVVAFDHRTSIAELLHHVFEFAAFESCGKCTPCRLGSRRVARILSRAVERNGDGGGARGHGPTERDRVADRSEVDDIVSALRHTSLCGLGTGLAELADSVARHYPEELARCLG
jgi:NADH:ubiquinone oxidoreductase subunit F (NADH-binding)